MNTWSLATVYIIPLQTGRPSCTGTHIHCGGNTDSPKHVRFQTDLPSSKTSPGSQTSSTLHPYENGWPCKIFIVPLTGVGSGHCGSSIKCIWGNLSFFIRLDTVIINLAPVYVPCNLTPVYHCCDPYFLNTPKCNQTSWTKSSILSLTLFKIVVN